MEDGLKPRQGQQQALRVRQGPGGEAGARPAGDYGDLQAMTDPQDGLDLVGGVGQSHRQGQLAVGGEAVALVGVQVLGLVQHLGRGQDAQQPGHQLRLAGGAGLGGQGRLGMGVARGVATGMGVALVKRSIPLRPMTRIRVVVATTLMATTWLNRHASPRRGERYKKP